MALRMPHLIQKLWAVPFLRFLVVGGINTIFGYSAFAVCILVGMHYVLAAFVSTILGILFNFKTTGIIVFKCHDNRLIVRFFGVYGVTYVLSVLVLKAFKMMGVNVLVTAAFATLPLAAVSFLLMRRFVFPHGTERPSGLSDSGQGEVGTVSSGCEACAVEGGAGEPKIRD